MTVDEAIQAIDDSLGFDDAQRSRLYAYIGDIGLAEADHHNLDQIRNWMRHEQMGNVAVSVVDTLEAKHAADAAVTK